MIRAVSHCSHEKPDPPYYKQSTLLPRHPIRLCDLIIRPNHAVTGETWDSPHSCLKYAIQYINTPVHYQMYRQSLQPLLLLLQSNYELFRWLQPPLNPPPLLPGTLPSRSSERVDMEQSGWWRTSQTASSMQPRSSLTPSVRGKPGASRGMPGSQMRSCCRRNSDTPTCWTSMRSTSNRAAG